MECIAFIPVRGGSKSIPQKNIRIFWGKPLVYWNLAALAKSCLFDSIVVATDDDEIERVVFSFNIPNLKIYRRSLESASDTASTEIVILEYIQKSILEGNLSPDSIFVTVQATSPLTRTIDFNNALNLFRECNFDSVLSCTRVKRFFWDINGTPKNYDYKNRPRRQDFEGELMENGAIYISRVKNILLSKNRLNGNIGLYEMPEYTGFEIDEETDWQITENIMRKHAIDYSYASVKKSIKMVLSDVDGVLTDAGMYYSEEGDEMKKFNTRDGMGFQILRNMGVKVGIITSENTKIVERRADKLKLDYLIQGKQFEHKLAGAISICEKEFLSLEEIAYIGDDINCKMLLSQVGFAACPADAVDEIKSIPGIRILSKQGGNGVFRELIDLLIKEEHFDYEKPKNSN